MGTTADIRNGLCFRHKNDIYTVKEFLKSHVGRGGATVKVKIKSLTTGKTIEETFNSGAKIDEIRVERRIYQYLYMNGDMLVFMNEETFEQIELAQEMIDNLDLIEEGEKVEVLFDSEREVPLTVEIPKSVIREIVYTEPGIRGDTATNTLKPAKLASGATIKVPLFINEGDKIKIDTTTRKYVERVKK